MGGLYLSRLIYAHRLYLVARSGSSFSEEVPQVAVLGVLHDHVEGPVLGAHAHQVDDVHVPTNHLNEIDMIK